MALLDTLAGKEPAKRDGLTAEQRFFLGWGQVWCENITEESARLQAQTNPQFFERCARKRSSFEYARNFRKRSRARWVSRWCGIRRAAFGNYREGGGAFSFLSRFRQDEGSFAGTLKFQLLANFHFLFAATFLKAANTIFAAVIFPGGCWRYALPDPEFRGASR